MFSLKRNQIIISALVVMICVAGYLNYIDTKNNPADMAAAYDLTSSGDIAAIILDDVTGQEVAVYNPGSYNYETVIETGINGNTGGTGGNGTNEYENEQGSAVFVSASSETSFFVQAKLNREQDRSKQKDTLTTLINSNDVDKETKALCAEVILGITDRLEKESATEAALVAKGFGESYVRIDESWVEVIINKHIITDQELAQIEDIVTRLTGATIDKVRLSSVKID